MILKRDDEYMGKVGDKVGDCGVVVAGETETAETVENKGEELAKAIFFGILDRAIADLKEVNKDYHGLEFIKTVVTMGGDL